MAEQILAQASEAAIRSRRTAQLREQDVYGCFREEFERGPVDRKRRESTRDDVVAFWKTYAPDLFYLPLATHHYVEAEKLQAAIKNKAKFANADSRGGGKTTRCRWSLLWAVLHGHCRYVVYIGATAGAAQKTAASIRKALQYNQLLREDFPEACLPIKHCNGKAQRANHQLWDGEPSELVVGSMDIVLAHTTCEWSQCDQAVFDFVGMEGEIRGRSYDLPTGENVRPDLAVADDPQTRKSAKSPSETMTREEILAGDVAYMCGPDSPIGVLSPCTVIYPDDLADRMLNRQLHPEWQGARTRFLLTMPANAKWWGEYADLRRAAQAADTPPDEVERQCNELYTANREIADEGASVSWEHRKFDCEVSAIQHAMNRRITNQEAFEAEYQNQPADPTQGEDLLRTVNSHYLLGHQSGLMRGVVPDDCTQVTAFVDISESVLWWAVCGWTETFKGYVIDYGQFPDQRQKYPTLKSVRNSLVKASGIASAEGSIAWGLQELWQTLFAGYQSESGEERHVSTCLTDANWQNAAVTQLIRRSQMGARLYPSYGKGVTALQAPIHQWNIKSGERIGPNWKTSRMADKSLGVVFDTNFWKTTVYRRLAVPPQDSASLTLFKASRESHRAFCDQVTAEYYEKSTARGRTVEVWAMKPRHSDNHWLDCLVGCAVGASMSGCRLPGMPAVKTVRKRKRTKVAYL